MSTLGWSQILSVEFYQDFIHQQVNCCVTVSFLTKTMVYDNVSKDSQFSRKVYGKVSIPVFSSTIRRKINFVVVVYSQIAIGSTAFCQ